MLKYKKLTTRAKAPVRANPTDSGMDVFSAVDTTIQPWKDELIPTDLAIEIPPGYDIAVYNKSGRSLKNKLIHGSHLIDCSYRGNLMIHLFNLSDEVVVIDEGEKIAQLVVRPVWLGEPEEVEELSDTERGTGGFGSSGLK